MAGPAAATMGHEMKVQPRRRSDRIKEPGTPVTVEPPLWPRVTPRLWGRGAGCFSLMEVMPLQFHSHVSSSGTAESQPRGLLSLPC